MKKIGLLTLTLLFLCLKLISNPGAVSAATSSNIAVSIVMEVDTSINLAASYPNVAWSVSELNGSATDKAVVSSTGVVTAKKPGVVKVTATATDGTNYTGEILITIHGEEPATQAAVLNGPDTAPAGSSFDLIYGLRNITETIYGQDITVTFDPSQLEFVSATATNENATPIVGISQKAGQVRILLATLGQSNTSAVNGDLVRLHWNAKSLSQSTPATVMLSQVLISDGNGHESDLSAVSHSVNIQVTQVDKQALNTLIASAQSKHDAAVEGTLPGQHTSGSKAALQTAIDSASTVAASSSSTQGQIDAAVTALNSAVQTFDSAVVPPTPGDQNNDGILSIGDVALITAAYGKSDQDPDWDLYKNCDLVKDGIIDIQDLATAARAILDAWVTN